MINSAKQWCERLGIDYSDKILPYYEKGTELYNQMGYFAIDKERLKKYNKEYNIFRVWFGDVLTACDIIKNDDDLMIYIYTLIAVIQAKEDIGILPVPDRKCMDTDFAPLYSLLYFLDDMIDGMKKRGCSYEIISDTLNGFDSEMNDYHRIYGRSGMRIYIWWFMLFVRGEILRIGRFQFEIKQLTEKVRVYEKDGDVKVLIDGEYMHRQGMVFGSAGQTDEDGKYLAEISCDGKKIKGYAANELGECDNQQIELIGYREVLKSGDYVINVHIPSDGPLDFEYSEQSYNKAKELFVKYYNEYEFKAFVCFSWLLEKRLKQIMGKDTNITRFADMYTAFPIKSSGKAVYSFLYNVSSNTPIDELPENSSMHRLVKEYLKSGNVFYEKGGVRLF